MEDFDHFATTHASSLLRTAYLMVRSQDEAEDLVQETLLAVARRWPRVQGMDAPVAYARRVLLHLIIDGTPRRRQRRDELSAAGPQPPAVEDRALASVEHRDELLGALAALSTQQRAVLVLRYFNDLSERQIADALGCSTGTVKTSASRGLAKLRSALTSATGEARR